MTTVSAERPAERPALAARLLSEPLPQLLADLGAEITEVADMAAGFVGIAAVDQGRISIFLAPGFDREGRDSLARLLLADLTGVDLAPPSILQFTTIYGGRA
ncbi:hypothetical protein [Streptomyces sp. SCSIO ZS0520]|uniref:hypothetical protein n=1 Tax=Streptomyces sp. SCSIO ZS0520 TaxID=2892996 RepID=UPI0021D7DC4D|nr:hypothetical protein [Streptomyces sp. SCSIO ZS0520]